MLASVQPLRLEAISECSKGYRGRVRQQQCPSVPRLALLLRPLAGKIVGEASTMMSDGPCGDRFLADLETEKQNAGAAR